MEGEDDGWNDQQEAAFQEEKQLAYEVTLTLNVLANAFSSGSSRVMRNCYCTYIRLAFEEVSRQALHPERRGMMASCLVLSTICLCLSSL